MKSYIILQFLLKTNYLFLRSIGKIFWFVPTIYLKTNKKINKKINVDSSKDCELYFLNETKNYAKSLYLKDTETAKIN